MPTLVIRARFELATPALRERRSGPLNYRIIGGELENRTLLTFLAKECRQPWDMAPHKILYIVAIVYKFRLETYTSGRGGKI